MLCDVVQGYNDLQKAAMQAKQRFVTFTGTVLSTKQHELRRQEYLQAMEKPIERQADTLRNTLRDHFGGKDKVKLTNNNRPVLKKAFTDTAQLLKVRSWKLISDASKKLIRNLDKLAKDCWDSFVADANKIFEKTMEGFNQTSPAIQFPEDVIQAPTVTISIESTSFDSLITNVPVIFFFYI